ncbi:MAG: hypothetical protein ACRDSZ_10330 [Pseudonocardiaceae bacterium]
MDQVRLRAAEPREAGEITALAHRSKGYWGYDRESLDRVRESLRSGGTTVVQALHGMGWDRQDRHGDRVRTPLRRGL